MGKILQENPLLEKISILKDRFSQSDSTDQYIIQEWERAAKTAIITANLQEHEGVQMILEHIEKERAIIDEALTTLKSDQLSIADRDNLIGMKNFYDWFSSFFTTAHSEIADLKASVDNELNAE